jgi:hypothetical protein
VSDVNGMDELLAIVRKQQEAIVEITERLDRIQASQESKKAPPNPVGDTPIDWMTISGPARLAAWKGLATFVEQLVERYGLQMELQPCWWQHNDAVEELTALWQVRLNTFQEGKGLTAAMSWQDSLSRSLGRLGPMFMSCREYHVDADPGQWQSVEERNALWHAIHADVHGTDHVPPEDTPPGPWLSD